MYTKNLRSCFFLIFVLFLFGCTKVPSEVHLTGPTMGTTYNVKFWSADEVDETKLHTAIDTELVLVNKLMSTYDPQSELSQFNKSDSSQFQSLSPATITVINEALRLGELSDGYLDITIGPLVNLWGFGPQARPEVIPDEQTIEATRAKVGMEKLVVREGSAQKLHPDMYVDLSTVAKGYGVDQVAKILEKAGIANYLVEVGGEMRLSGAKANGNSWVVAIEKPVSSERSIQTFITVGDNAIATSGDYRNYYEESGRRYSHLIDPKTGFPIQHNLVSVTVVHPSCMTADGFATAISVMGKDKGLDMALQNNLAVMLITRENGEFKEYTTAAFDALM